MSWRNVSYFYEGLTNRERQFVEMMCNREFLQKDPNEAIEYLNDLVEKAHTWTGPNSVQSTNRSRPNASTLSSGGIYQMKEEDSCWHHIYTSYDLGPHSPISLDQMPPLFLRPKVGLGPNEMKIDLGKVFMKNTTYFWNNKIIFGK